jgi:hypothetical protein
VFKLEDRHTDPFAQTFGNKTDSSKADEAKKPLRAPEPIPVFDCPFCTLKEHFVLIKTSEQGLKRVHSSKTDKDALYKLVFKPSILDKQDLYKQEWNLEFLFSSPPP